VNTTEDAEGNKIDEEETAYSIPLSLVSQEDSVERLTLLPELSSGRSKTIFYVSNVLDYVLKYPENLTSDTLSGILTEDLAKLNALGYVGKLASAVVSNFLTMRFDELSKSFF